MKVLEAALGLFRAVHGGDGRQMADGLLTTVYERPAGDVAQTMGSVAVTLEAVAELLGLSAGELKEWEIKRILRAYGMEDVKS